MQAEIRIAETTEKVDQRAMLPAKRHRRAASPQILPMGRLRATRPKMTGGAAAVGPAVELETTGKRSPHTRVGVQRLLRLMAVPQCSHELRARRASRLRTAELPERRQNWTLR